jgi:hypothetical protein
VHGEPGEWRGKRRRGAAVPRSRGALTCLLSLDCSASGLFVLKPSRDADNQGCSQRDLGTAVRQRPLVNVAIDAQLVTRSLWGRLAACRYGWSSSPSKIISLFTRFLSWP